MGTSQAAEEQYHLKWNDYHSSLTKCFRDLRDNHEMLDVTIISDGRTFKAHKLVLSACSPIFKAMLKKDKGPFMQPLIFLHGVRQEDVLAILDFMYNGEVSVNQDDLRSFLNVAEDLRVRGLTQFDNSESHTKNLEHEDDIVVENKQYEQQQQQQRKRKLSKDRENDDEIVVNPRDFNETPRKRNYQASPYSQQDFHSLSPSTPKSALRRSSSLMDAAPTGNVSYHYLGGRDHDDPLSSMMVARSDKGWHCPDCIHIATTKGNLKSHILSGRHKLMEKNFKCRFCDRSYSTRQSMQVHISTNHRQERDMEMRQSGDGAPPPPGLNHSNSNTFDEAGEQDFEHHAEHPNHPDLDLRNSIAENDDDDPEPEEPEEPEISDHGELPVAPETEIQPPPPIVNFNTTSHD